MNKSKLKAILVLNNMTQERLADILNISPQRLSAKINSRSGAEFTQGEIGIIKKLFNLTSNEVDLIFFDDFVSNKDTKLKH